MQQRTLINCMKSTLAALIVSFALLLIFCAGAYRMADPEQSLAIMAYITLYIGGALCGLLSARLEKERGLIVGAVSGTIYSSILLILSSIIERGKGLNTGFALLMLLSVIIESAVFGRIFIPKGVSVNKRRREIRKKYSSK